MFFSSLHQSKLVRFQSYYNSFLAGDSIFWTGFCKPGERIIFFLSVKLHIRNSHRGYNYALEQKEMHWKHELTTYRCTVDDIWVQGWMEQIWSDLWRQAQDVGPVKFSIESLYHGSTAGKIYFYFSKAEMLFDEEETVFNKLLVICYYSTVQAFHGTDQHYNPLTIFWETLSHSGHTNVCSWSSWWIFFFWNTLKTENLR